MTCEACQIALGKLNPSQMRRGPVSPMGDLSTQIHIIDMFSITTINYYKNFVIMENFICISRPYLIKNQKTRVICEIISITIGIIIIGIIAMNLINVKQSIGFRIFELIIGLELFGLAVGSRFRKGIFHSIEKLDDKCGVDAEIGSKIQAKTIAILSLFLPSIILDFIGLVMLGVDMSFSIFLCVAFAAHDAEIAFVSLLVDTINMRIETLKNALPNTGSRIYRHVLIATAHFSEQYTPKVLLLLGVTLITTVAYEFILVLTDSEKILHLSLYLLWRESRSMYSLWLMCSAVARTDSICSELALHLAGRLAYDQSISKVKNPIQYKTVRRWYSIVVSQRPRYISGSILSIGLSTPILVVDLSINYMLIIIQMYLAYK